MLVAIVLLEAAVLFGFVVLYAVELVAGNAETSPGGAAFRYEETLALADSALYEAKRDGRDRTVVAA